MHGTLIKEEIQGRIIRLQLKKKVVSEMEGNREGGSSEGSLLWVSVYIDTQGGSKLLEKYEVSKRETEVPKREKEEHIPSTSFGSCTFKN